VGVIFFLGLDEGPSNLAHAKNFSH